MKIKTYMKILTVIFALSLFMSISYAAKIVSTEGNIKTVGVDVNVSVDTDTSNVYPGKAIKYEPKISYKGVDSYIRMKLDFDNENISEDMFSKLDDKWLKKGDYFYYKDTVKHGDTINSFKTLTIPKEWNEDKISEFNNSKFTVTVLCDAIQAKNFSPDFNGEKPWGDIDIIEGEYEGSDFVADRDEEEKVVNIRFNGAGQFEINSNDLLSKNILPGDTIKGTIDFTNNGKRNLKVIFFASKDDSVNEDEKNLLDKCKLSLFINGNKIYDGNLRGEALYEKNTLFSLKPNETKELNYEIHMPEEIDNEFSNKSNSFFWNFSSENEEKDVISIIPKTGDKTILGFYLILSMVSVVLLLLQKKWRNSNDV